MAHKWKELAILIKKKIVGNGTMDPTAPSRRVCPEIKGTWESNKKGAFGSRMAEFKGPIEKTESKITRGGTLYPWDMETFRMKGIERGGGWYGGSNLDICHPQRPQLSPIKGCQDQNIQQDESKIITRKEGEFLRLSGKMLGRSLGRTSQLCISEKLQSKETPSMGHMVPGALCHERSPWFL